MKQSAHAVAMSGRLDLATQSEVSSVRIAQCDNLTLSSMETLSAFLGRESLTGKALPLQSSRDKKSSLGGESASTRIVSILSI
jgi:hypothetical protein